MQKKSGLPPVYPGEILKEDVLPSAGLTVTAAAKAHGFDERLQLGRFHGLRLILPDAAAGENQFVKSHLFTSVQVLDP
jgi:hypothetical protein